MNFELTVAESFDSSWSLLQSLHINFLTSNSCECPHRLLDLIVKERDSLSCRGMRILRFPDSESSTFCCLAPGRFGPANTAAAFSEECLPCRVIGGAGAGAGARHAGGSRRVRAPGQCVDGGGDVAIRAGEGR